MRVKVKNKKRFGIWCFVFFLMLLNVVFAINERMKGNESSYENNKALVSNVALAADKDGSIAYSESKYFKRYVLDCENDISKVRWDEGKDYIDIMLQKNDLAKLSIKGENAAEAKEISYDNSKEKLIIRIKKLFNDNNFVQIDSNDNKKIIILISKEENPFKHTIVLDAGHGGVDKGANFGSLYEKDITFKITNYAADELMFNGFKVVKTRDKDKLLELKEISDIANSASADLFISFHINDNKVNKYKGVTTYYYDVNGYQKDERIKLAKTIQKELVKSDGWEDRGIARGNLAVLRNTNIPCVLLESGFMSNEEDRGKLMKDEILKSLALNTVRGIMNYFSLE